MVRVGGERVCLDCAVLCTYCGFTAAVVSAPDDRGEPCDVCVACLDSYWGEGDESGPPTERSPMVWADDCGGE